ncbi:MAG: hypothetical protein V1750_03870 [Acidobacteriota bacterium]
MLVELAGARERREHRARQFGQAGKKALARFIVREEHAAARVAGERRRLLPPVLSGAPPQPRGKARMSGHQLL